MTFKRYSRNINCWRWCPLILTHNICYYNAGLRDEPFHRKEQVKSRTTFYRRWQRMVRRRVPFIGDSNAWLGGEFRLSEVATHG